MSTGKLQDGRQLDRMDAYAKHWQKDLKKDTQADMENRNADYENVVNGYYDGATELYEWGWGSNFHFSRFYKGEAFNQSIARHQHYLASQIGLKKGMRVLDVGCGIGGPAREIARFADVTIVGVNNNEFQINRARRYTAKAGLSDQVTFVKGDFMKLAEQFGENSFDAVYAIEATVHAPMFEGVYGEIMKVLKPGGVCGIYEWVMTPEWDPSNPTHKQIAHEIEISSGIPEMRKMDVARRAFDNVGLEVLHEEDLADRPDPIPWYYPLEGDIFKAQTLYDLFMCWRISWSGRLISHSAIWAMEKVGIMPKGTIEVTEQLKQALKGIVDGGKLKLFTPMYLVVARKPGKPE
ncbi:hypothetical protein M408DRAFT_331417 [Serendipita vermifera MAFF 305830]|uniref:SAM-dependent methyltransferase Erg6/SMT-type domain-containing protein n=1 Tax=Serendipita vermifera MAFF 305830 TaxID=933852 RepID=A0A0C3B0V5_SERVB|nr:hypothetical protein M408DRAFT_331417 [Serendipita vermifera MAFF 305830]